MHAVFSVKISLLLLSALFICNGATANAIDQATILKPDSPEEITNRANEAHAQKQWKTASELYQLALDKNPEYFIAIFNLGLTYQRWAERQITKNDKNSKYFRARDAFREAKMLRPNDPAVLAHLGIIAHHLHEYQEAKDFFDEAIKNTTDPYVKSDFYYNKATTLMAMKKHEAAKEAYQNCIEFRPDHFSAHFNLGTLALSLQEYRLADIHLSQAASIDPERPEPEVNRAIVALNRGGHQVSKAEDHLNRAVTLARQHNHHSLKDILWLRADFYYQVELPEKQTRLLMRYDLEELLNIEPNYPGANGRLGMYFEALAEFDKAISHLEAELALTEQGITKPDGRIDEKAHHLLAIIYSDHKRNPRKAIIHATAYSRMRPGAQSDRLSEHVQNIK